MDLRHAVCIRETSGQLACLLCCFHLDVVGGPAQAAGEAGCVPRMLPALFLHGGCQHHNHKRVSFILLVLLPSHALAGLGLWWDRGDLSFLWTLSADPFSSLTPCTSQVLCTMSDCAMYMECGCLHDAPHQLGSG